jgi:large subunit ribosomal protein L24e
MVQERTCDYTGEAIEPGTGIMYIANDGTVMHFVDSKAEKNYLLGREPRDLEWTTAGRGSSRPEQTTTGTAEPDAEDTASEPVVEETTEAAESGAADAAEAHPAEAAEEEAVADADVDAAVEEEVVGPDGEDTADAADTATEAEDADSGEEAEVDSQ